MEESEMLKRAIVDSYVTKDTFDEIIKEDINVVHTASEFEGYKELTIGDVIGLIDRRIEKKEEMRKRNSGGE